MSDADDLSAQMERALRVRAGADPRWRKLGNASEMGVLSGIGWAAWLAERMPARRIPGAAWALDAVGGDRGVEEVAVIACPCGHEAHARVLDAPSPCAEDECDCPRSFFFDGEHVYCFNSPEEIAPPMGRL